ncbi:hypothetical protein CASFOL_003819 [Castilleja foliolosa]|uniref:Uncharacterized protein n=1 Tax=Castilleja foliolosa TaxID=1961234 RepID=A0ABD3EIK7_9LAMI
METATATLGSAGYCGVFSDAQWRHLRPGVSIGSLVADGAVWGERARRREDHSQGAARERSQSRAAAAHRSQSSPICSPPKPQNRHHPSPYTPQPPPTENHPPRFQISATVSPPSTTSQLVVAFKLQTAADTFPNCGDLEPPPLAEKPGEIALPISTGGGGGGATVESNIQFSNPKEFKHFPGEIRKEIYLDRIGLCKFRKG